jgi:hypothetical protein
MQTLLLKKALNLSFSSSYSFKQFFCKVIRHGTLNLGSIPFINSLNPSLSTCLKGNSLLMKYRTIKFHILFESYFMNPIWSPLSPSTSFLNDICNNVWFLGSFDFLSGESVQLEVRWVIMRWVIMAEVPFSYSDTLSTYCNNCT